MKFTKRHNVFETNSSSMHSIVIKKKDEYCDKEEINDGIYLWKDGSWNVYDGNIEFGRSPFRIMNSFVDKWYYACASLVKDYNDDRYLELENLAKKYINGLNEIKMPTKAAWTYNKANNPNSQYAITEEELIEKLYEKEKKYNIECIDYWNDSVGDWRWDEPDTGYVDQDILSGFLEKENVSLEEFLTNKKYVVIQDGDEYCYWNDAKESGLINLDEIDYEFPKGD